MFASPHTSLLLIQARPGRSAALGACLEGLPYPGQHCFTFAIKPSQEDGNCWLVYGQWRSQADMDSYFNALPAAFWARLVNGSIAARMHFMTVEENELPNAYRWATSRFGSSGCSSYACYG
jgi:quinol monooxygenase YgiN